MIYTSELIAEYTGKCHKTVCELIKNHKSELKNLSKLGVESTVIKHKTAGRPKVVFNLNEDQAMYILIKMSSRTNIDNAIIKLGFENKIKIVRHRNELEFLKILEMIIDGFNQGTDNCISLKHQYGIGGNMVDYCILQTIAGEEDIIMLIEYDEYNHKYYKPEDLEREKRIIKYLTDDDTSGDFDIKICRVTDDNFLNAISDIICCMNSEMCINGAGRDHNMNTVTIHRIK